MELFKGYIKIDEAAEKWGVTRRCVQNLCANGKIDGAERFGRDWMIPKNALKPVDGRTKEGRKQLFGDKTNMPMPKKTPFLHMTDLYSVPGSFQKSIDALSENPEARLLLAAWFDYSRGEADKVYEIANYLLNKHSGFYAIISAGMLLAFAAIWKGDLNMWRKAKMHIAQAPSKTDHERDIIAFSITSVDSMLYDVSSFPEWFKKGCFEPLHKDSLPAAKVFYAKYLYAVAYAIATKEIEIEGTYGLYTMSTVPYAIEPMISQAIADGSVMTEAYLRLTCATVYHTVGNDKEAIRHIDCAVSLAIADRLYGVLAEYCRTLGTLLQNSIVKVDPAVWENVRLLYKTYNEGWSKLSGSVRGKYINTTLSAREFEVAKLAAFGMKNGEISQKLNMSISGVKQAITNISSKTGMRRGQFAAIL